MFREESIKARAKQVLGINDFSESDLKKRFNSLIRKYHPDTIKSQYNGQTEEQAKLLIEAYKVLSGKINPLECKLLENDKLLSSLLPYEACLVELGIKYEDWVKDRFYDFVKPHEDINHENNEKKRVRRGL